MKTTENEHEDETIGGIAKKISDGLYINIHDIPKHPLDYEKDALAALHQDSDKIFEKTIKNKPNNLLFNDKDQGNETIGIP